MPTSRQRAILTVGELRRIIAPLTDRALVEVNVGGEGFGNGISAEIDEYGGVAFVGIHVEPHTTEETPHNG